MGQVYKKMGKVLDSRVPLLFQAEAGAGKESLARVIHGAGKQRHGPFVVVQCQAASEEQLEMELFGTSKLGEIRGGTVFLKNVDALSPTLQLRILQAFQDHAIRHPESHETREIDLRVIASTKKKLDLEVSAGTFRQDLCFRLTVYQCDLPPLRERKPDIPKFAGFFADKLAESTGGEPLVFTARALSMLQTHDWPGNIGELKQVLFGSMMQVGKSNRTVDQIKWMSSNVNGNLVLTSLHGAERPEGEGLKSRFEEELHQQTTFIRRFHHGL